MTAPPPCPFRDCRATEPHRHGSLGEGQYGPRLAEGEPGAPSDEMEIVEVEGQCPDCGDVRQVPAFKVRGKAPANPQRRRCEPCKERAAAEAERHANARIVPLAPDSPARLPAPRRL